MNRKGNIVLWAVIGTAIILSGGLTVKYLSSPKKSVNKIAEKPLSTIWAPKSSATFQIQLSEKLDKLVDAEIYDIDLFDTGKEEIQKLHSAGKKVICYFSAGSRENWRPDSNDFPKSIIGKDYTGWEGEKWLDIRRIDLIGPIMQKRIVLAKEKGCDGIDPDNVDAHNNDTGFPLTAEDQLKFNIWLAKEAHQQGLAIGLKNDPEQIKDLLPYYNWTIAESCFAQDWCDQLKPFINNGKPVFQIEYTDAKINFRQACEEAKQSDFSIILKNRQLDAWIQVCK